MMLELLKSILMSYDDLIAERLSKTGIYGSKARKGLGRHVRKDAPDGLLCRERKEHKRGMGRVLEEKNSASTATSIFISPRYKFHNAAIFERY